MAVKDGCANAVSVTLNESIVLFGHGTDFKSHDTVDSIILLAFFFLNVK